MDRLDYFQKKKDEEREVMIQSIMKDLDEDDELFLSMEHEYGLTDLREMAEVVMGEIEFLRGKDGSN